MSRAERKRDFGIPLTEAEHEDLRIIVETIESQIGVKISRRELVAKAVRDFIKKQKIKLDINDDDDD